MDDTIKNLPQTQILVKIDSADPKKSKLLIREPNKNDEYVDAVIFTPAQIEFIEDLLPGVEEKIKERFKQEHPEMKVGHVPFFKRLFRL